jgi:SulP family sulfate permease
MAGPIAGGLFSSTQRLVVTTTTAAAIAGGAAISGLPPEERANALFLMTILTGALAVAAGLLRLGSLTRFVSHSVMVGFLTGIAVLIILGQLGTLTGYARPSSMSWRATTSESERREDASMLPVLIAQPGTNWSALQRCRSRDR